MVRIEKNATHISVESTYALPNTGSQTSARFDALAAIFDPGTIRHIEERGISREWKCLEVGGGGGSIAAWLCERTGPAGRVLATDIDTGFLEKLCLPNLEVRRHDIVSDPLPEAAFDLVHTRLVLMHLPERETALKRMAAAVRPGGWLLIEEFDAFSIYPDPSISPFEVRLRTNVAFRQIVAERNVELRYGRLLPGLLRAHGLINIGAEGRVFMWQGSSAGATLTRATCEQLRGAIINSGLISEWEFDRDLARLDEEDYLAPSPILWAAWGLRPSE